MTNGSNVCGGKPRSGHPAPCGSSCRYRTTASGMGCLVTQPSGDFVHMLEEPGATSVVSSLASVAGSKFTLRLCLGTVAPDVRLCDGVPVADPLPPKGSAKPSSLARRAVVSSLVIFPHSARCKHDINVGDRWSCDRTRPALFPPATATHTRETRPPPLPGVLTRLRAGYAT